MSSATNTVHFACFECRRSLKQRGSSNWDPTVPHRGFPCPDCHGEMVRLGRHFKAPVKRAIRQWLKVELLYAYGERFSASRSGLGSACPTLSAAVAYLVNAGHARSDVRTTLATIRAAHDWSGPLAAHSKSTR